MSGSDPVARFLCCSLVLLTGCDYDLPEVANSSVTVVDSLGWEVSTIAPPRDTLELPERRLLTVGASAGDPDHELFEVTGARILPSGLVVANSGTGEILFFDWDGQRTRSYGRRGRGPGEFWGQLSLHSFGRDSVAVFDMGAQRVTVLSRHDSGARELRIPSSHLGRAFGILPMSSTKTGGVHLQIVWRPPLMFGLREGLGLDSAVVGRLADTIQGDQLVSIPVSDRYVRVVGGMQSKVTPLFGRSIPPVSRNGRICHVRFSGGVELECPRHGQDGGAILRVLTERLRVTDDLEAHQRSRRTDGALPRFVRYFEEIFDEMPHPDSVPAIWDANVASDGTIILGEFPHPSRSTRTWWLLGASDGAAKALELPQGHELLDVRRDTALLLRKDAFDVEWIDLYRLGEQSPGTPEGL